MRLAEEAEGVLDDEADIPAFNETRRAERGERAPRSEQRPRRERRDTPEPGMTRIFIGAGRNMGIRPGDIVGAIANEAGISSRAIGAIDISDRFTLAEVDSGMAGEVVNALQGARFKGRTVLVKLDGGRPVRSPRDFDGDHRDFERIGRSDRFDRTDRTERSNRLDRSNRFEQFDRRRGSRR